MSSGPFDTSQALLRSHAIMKHSRAPEVRGEMQQRNESEVFVVVKMYSCSFKKRDLSLNTFTTYLLDQNSTLTIVVPLNRSVSFCQAVLSITSPKPVSSASSYYPSFSSLQS